MNPEELKKQLEEVEKKKKRNAILLSLGFAVLAVIIILSIYGAFVKNAQKERTESTKYSLFERIFGKGAKKTTTTNEVTTDDSTKQITGTEKQTKTTFSSLTEKWFTGYKSNITTKSTNIVRPLAVSMNVFDDPAYVKKYGKVDKTNATLEDISKAVEFSSEKKSEIKDQLDVLTNQFDGYQNEVQIETDKLKQLKEELARLEEFDNKSGGSDVSTKILSDKEKTDIRTQIAELNKKIATLEEYQKTHPNDSASLKSAIASQLKSLKDQVLLLESKLNSTPNSNYTRSAQIQSLKKQIEALEGGIASYNQIDTVVGKQIESLTKQYEGLEKQIISFQSTASEVKNQVEGYYNEYSKLDKQTKDYINQVKNFNVQILKSDPMLKGVSPQLLSFISQLGTLMPQNETFTKQISALHAQTTFLNLQVSSLTDTKTPVKVSTLKVPVFTTKYQIGPLSNGIAELRPSLISFVSETKGVWDSIGFIEPQVKTMLLQLDYNNDGKLSTGDYEQQLDKSKFTGATWKQILAAYDTNNDGKVSVKELGAALDKDYNGVLKKLNLEKQFADLEKQYTALEQQYDAGKLTGNTWKQFLAAYDKDNDGKISTTERANAMKTNLADVLAKLSLVKQNDVWDPQLDKTKYTGITKEKYLAAYDLNKDGKVSMAELKKAIDINYEGVLTQLDLKKQNDPKEYTGITWVKFLAAYDLNGDKVVTKKEMNEALDEGNTGALKTLSLSRQLDLNGDGVVSEDEMTGTTWSTFMKVFDTDGDGFVTIQEMNDEYDNNFAAVTTQLNLVGQLDMDGDGSITVDDFEGVSVITLVQEFDGIIPFTRADGFVSVDEISYGLSDNSNGVYERLGYVSQLDIDGDNQVARPYIDLFGNFVVDSNELTNIADIDGNGVFDRCYYYDMYGNCVPEGLVQRDNNNKFNSQLGIIMESDYLEADADGDGKINPCYYIDKKRQCVIEGYSPNNYNYNGSPDYFFQLDTNGDNIYNELDAFDPYVFINQKSASLPIYVSTEESWYDSETGETQIAVHIDYTPGSTILKQMSLQIVAYSYDKETRQSSNERRIGGTCSTSQSANYVVDETGVAPRDIKYCYFRASGIGESDYFDIEASIVGPTSMRKRPTLLGDILGIVDPLRNYPLVTYGTTTIPIDEFNSFSSIEAPASKWYFMKGPNKATDKSGYYVERESCLRDAKAFAGGNTQPPCYRDLVSRATYYYFTKMDPNVEKSPEFASLAECQTAANAAKAAAKTKKEAEDKKQIEELKKNGKVPILKSNYSALTYACINSENDPVNTSYVNQENKGINQNTSYIGLMLAIRTDYFRTNKRAEVEFAALSATPEKYVDKDGKATGNYNVTFSYWKEGKSKSTNALSTPIKKFNSGSSYKGAYDKAIVYGEPGEQIFFEFTETVPDLSTEDPNDTKVISVSGIRSVTLMTTEEYEAFLDIDKSPVNQSMYEEVSAAAPTFSGFEILQQGIIFCGYDGYWPTYDASTGRFNFTLPAAFVVDYQKYGIKKEKIEKYSNKVYGEGGSALTYDYAMKIPTHVKAYNRQVDENELCSWPHTIATFNRIVDIILKLFIPMAIGILIMIIGMKYLIAAYRGDSVNIAQYKKALWRIVLGTVLILCSFLIVKVIITKLNQEKWFGQFIDVTGNAKSASNTTPVVTTGGTNQPTTPPTTPPETPPTTTPPVLPPATTPPVVTGGGAVAKLPEQYIDSFGTWPPSISVFSGSYSCQVTSSPNSSVIIEQKTIKGKLFCVSTTINSSGTKNYSYKTAGDKAETYKTADVSLDFVNCKEEYKNSSAEEECLAVQRSFSIDAYMSSLKW